MVTMSQVDDKVCQTNQVKITEFVFLAIFTIYWNVKENLVWITR